MPLNDPIGSTAADVLAFNVAKEDEFVNSDENFYVDRFGNPRYTAQGLATLGGGGTIVVDVTQAVNVTYDNSTSGLTATDVQAAIDEIAAADGSTASGVSYNPQNSTISDGNVQDAIDTLSFSGVNFSVLNQFKSAALGSLSASNLNIVVLGDSTNCGIGDTSIGSPTPYGEANGYNTDGFGSAFAYAMIKSDDRFNTPPSMSVYYSAGIKTAALACPFPSLGLVVSELPFERIRIVNNSQTPTNSLTIYHNKRTSSFAARFRVRVYAEGTTTALADEIIDTYTPQVSYATNHDVQSSIASTTIAIGGSASQRSYDLVISDVDVIDRGTGVEADGTALYLGCTFGSGVSYNNLAVSSTTLKEGSAANISRGVDTSERLALAATFSPNLLLIGWGTNDSKTGVSTTADFESEYNTLIDSIRASNGDVAIVLMTAPAGAVGSIYENNTVYNEVIRKVALQKGCMYMDVEKLFDISPANAYADDVHPSSYGYEITQKAMLSLFGVVDQKAVGNKAPQGRNRIIAREATVPIAQSSDASGSFVDIYSTPLTIPKYAKSFRFYAKLVSAELGDIIDHEYEARLINNDTATTYALDKTIVRCAAASGTAIATVVLMGSYTPSVESEFQESNDFTFKIVGKNYTLRSGSAEHKATLEFLA